MSENTAGGFVMDTPEAIRFFTVRAVASAFALESVGLKVRGGSALKAARIQGILPATGRFTKKQGLEATIAELKRLNPEYKVTGTIKMALDKL